jgi:hypothetical protein
VTYAIRQDRKRAGEIAAGEIFTQHTALNWTEAQKREPQNYRPGQLLEFHKAVKGMDKNETVEVVSVDGGRVIGRKANGSIVDVTSRQAKAYGVFEPESIEVSAGDKLLLRANWKQKGFRATNGELVTVAAVTPNAITLDDGRTLPAAYKQFSHGYAVTAHRSQGKTVDAEVIVAERMKHDLFYVSATRARESLTVITSDSLTLQESITLSGDRQSATELSKRACEAKPSRDVKPDDLFRIYRAQQELDRIEQQPIIKPEITQHYVNHHDHAGIGPQF